MIIKNSNKPELGRVVQSTAGRDQGRFFAIIEIVDSDYVNVANGKHHKLSDPKRKKLKHLRLMDEVLESISDKLKRQAKVFDSELYSALKNTILNNNLGDKHV